MTAPLQALLPFLLLCVAAAHAADIEDVWNITYRIVSPDGVPKNVPVVNGQYPGPELRGFAGQTVRIVVNNLLSTDTTSIHWHGIKQDGTPWSDGVPGISQCPIGPGQSFVYEFKLDTPGTLWWHSHSGLQKSSLYGAIVILGDKHHLQYSHDETLLLNDWFHKSGTDILAGLLSPNFTWIGNPQSLLVNGRGTFDCEKYRCNAPSAEFDFVKMCNQSDPDAGPFYLDVLPDTVYRLRLIGASTLSVINIGIEDHLMSVVEVETSLLKPFSAEFLDVGAGESYSVLLKTKSREELEKTGHNGLFWIQLAMRLRKNGPISGAILRYVSSRKGHLPATTLPLPGTPEAMDVEWSVAASRKLQSLRKAHVPKAQGLIVMLGTQNVIQDGTIRWAMNNISYVEPSTPLLHSVKYSFEEETDKFTSRLFPAVFNYSASLSDNGLPTDSEFGTQVVEVAKDAVIDFVFQNTVSGSGALEVHTWHLHLHNFWVLKYGEKDQPFATEDIIDIDTSHAVFRNTFLLHFNGWTAVRVKFDNPGVAHFRILQWVWALLFK